MPGYLQEHVHRGGLPGKMTLDGHHHHGGRRLGRGYGQGLLVHRGMQIEVGASAAILRRPVTGSSQPTRGLNAIARGEDGDKTADDDGSDQELHVASLFLQVSTDPPGNQPRQVGSLRDPVVPEPAIRPEKGGS